MSIWQIHCQSSQDRVHDKINHWNGIGDYWLGIFGQNQSCICELLILDICWPSFTPLPILYVKMYFHYLTLKETCTSSVMHSSKNSHLSETTTNSQGRGAMFLLIHIHVIQCDSVNVLIPATCYFIIHRCRLKLFSQGHESEVKWSSLGIVTPYYASVRHLWHTTSLHFALAISRLSWRTLQGMFAIMTS